MPLQDLAFFMAVPGESDAALCEFRLNSYDELITFDIPGVIARDPRYERYRCPEPIFVTCTNGCVDSYCAKNGMQVYRALVEQVGDLAWQSTHIGGCCFAGNLVCFPPGVYYGRVEPDEVATIVGAFRQQRLYLEKYRGRLSLDLEADVAEYFLRRQTGAREVGQFRLITIEHEAENCWSAQFELRSTGAIYSLQVVRRRADYEDYLSCKATQKQRPACYHLVKYEVLATTRVDELKLLKSKRFITAADGDETEVDRR